MRYECEEFIEVRMLFESRVEEVGRFIEFNEQIASSKANRLALIDVPGAENSIVENYIIDRNLVKTFRASTFLILYNLVESTMTNAIDAIHQAMVNDECDYPCLTEEMQKVVLKNFKVAMKKAQPNESVFYENHPMKVSLTNFGYQKTFLFSGNICAKTIRDCAARYGFVIPDHDRRASKNGTRIYNIKDKRDHLAHGRISFEECGQEMILEDMGALFNETVTYLGAVLDGVEDFIANKRYLREVGRA